MPHPRSVLDSRVSLIHRLSQIAFGHNLLTETCENIQIDVNLLKIFNNKNFGENRCVRVRDSFHERCLPRKKRHVWQLMAEVPKDSYL